MNIEIKNCRNCDNPIKIMDYHTKYTYGEKIFCCKTCEVVYKSGKRKKNVLKKTNINSIYYMSLDCWDQEGYLIYE